MEERPGKEVGLLLHKADTPPKIVAADVPKVRVPDADAAAALRQIIEGIEELCRCRLSGAGSPKDSQGLPRTDREGDIREDKRKFLLVAEKDVREGDVLVEVRLLSAVSFILLFRGEDVGDAVDGDSRL